MIALHTTDKVGEALVEQVDRDALADHLNPLGEPEVPGSWVYSVRNGDEDSYSTLQLLARHRLAALASSRAGCEAAIMQAAMKLRGALIATSPSSDDAEDRV